MSLSVGNPLVVLDPEQCKLAKNPDHLVNGKMIDNIFWPYCDISVPNRGTRGSSVKMGTSEYEQALDHLRQGEVVDCPLSVEPGSWCFTNTGRLEIVTRPHALRRLNIIGVAYSERMDPDGICSHIGIKNEPGCPYCRYATEFIRTFLAGLRTSLNERGVSPNNHDLQLFGKRVGTFEAINNFGDEFGFREDRKPYRVDELPEVIEVRESGPRHGAAAGVGPDEGLVGRRLFEGGTGTRLW